MRYAPHAVVTPAVRPGRHYNYVFHTRMGCAKGCAPGAHPLYIGKSSDPWLRTLQHATRQPWFPAACGFSIYEGDFDTAAEALAAEEMRIVALQPLANIEHNLENDHRLWFGPLLDVPADYPRARRVVWPSGRRRDGEPRRRRRAAGRAWSVALRLVAVVAAWAALFGALSWASQRLRLAAIVAAAVVLAMVIVEWIVPAVQPSRRSR